MKQLLLLLLLLPVFAKAQNVDTTIIRGFYVYPDTIRQITIVDTFEQTIFKQNYNDKNVKVEVPGTPRCRYTVRINGLVVGKVECSCNGKIHFEIVPDQTAMHLAL